MITQTPPYTERHERCYAAPQPPARPRTTFCIELLGMPGAGKTTCSRLIPALLPELTTMIHNNENIEKEGILDKVRFNKRIADMLRKTTAYVGSPRLVIYDRGITDEAIWLNLHASMAATLRQKMQFEQLIRELPRIPSNIRQYRILFCQSKELTIARRSTPRHTADTWAITDECLEQLQRQYSTLEKTMAKTPYSYVLPTNQLSLSDLKNVFSSIIRRIAGQEGVRFMPINDTKAMKAEKSVGKHHAHTLGAAAVSA